MTMKNEDNDLTSCPQSSEGDRSWQRKRAGCSEKEVVRLWKRNGCSDESQRCHVAREQSAEGRAWQNTSGQSGTKLLFKGIPINKVTRRPIFFLSFISFQTLQLKLDEANEDLEDLQRKVQDHISDISRTEDLLSAKVKSTKWTTSMFCDYRWIRVLYFHCNLFQFFLFPAL